MRITILTTQQHPSRHNHSRYVYRKYRNLYHKQRLENGCMSVHPCVTQHIAFTSSYMQMYGNVVMRTRHDNK